MTDVTPLQGELQTQIMTAVWKLEEGTVEQIRRALPEANQGAYNTVQTVLNRLADRGLLERRREGHVIVYAPALSEADYLSRSIEHTMRSATPQARQVLEFPPFGVDHLERSLRHLAVLVRQQAAVVRAVPPD